MLDFLADPTIYASLISLTLLEVVLGIDNIIFIAILADKLPEHQRKSARSIGLILGLAGRLLLLFSISWLTKLTIPLFQMPFLGTLISVKDLVLLAGGLFLIAKSTKEIYDKIETDKEHLNEMSMKGVSFGSVIGQIILIDMVFALDSIITAVGLANQIGVMVISILLACVVMLWAVQPISSFIEKHPSLKILALSFLLMIGTMLVAEGFHVHVPKGYIYFSLAFALLIELLNIKAHSRPKTD